MSNVVTNAPDPIAASMASTRPRFTYSIPDEARLFASDPREITLEPLTMAQEQMALKAASAGGHVGFELAKHAVVAVDGRPLTWEGGAKDKFLETVSPPVRQLVLLAYDQIHNPNEGVKRAFREGRRTQV